MFYKSLISQRVCVKPFRDHFGYEKELNERTNWDIQLRIYFGKKCSRIFPSSYCLSIDQTTRKNLTINNRLKTWNWKIPLFYREIISKEIRATKSLEKKTIMEQMCLHIPERAAWLYCKCFLRLIIRIEI